MFCQVLHDVVFEILIDEDFRMKSVGLMIFRSCLHPIRFWFSQGIEIPKLKKTHLPGTFQWFFVVKDVPSRGKDLHPPKKKETFTDFFQFGHPKPWKPGRPTLCLFSW